MNKTIESLLRNSMGIFYDILNTTDNYIVLCDQHRQVLFVNPAFSKKVGYSLQDLSTKRFTSLFAKHHRARYAVQITKGLRDKGLWHGESEIQKNDESSFWAEIHVVLYTPPGSSQSYVICIGYDLTAKRLLMERLWRVENPSDQIIDAMREAIFVVDKDGKILVCNKSLPDMVSYAREEIIGMKPPFPWFEETDSQKFLQIFKKAQKGSPISNYHLNWTRKDRTHVMVSLVISPMQDRRPDSGSSFVVSARDISNMDLTDELKRAKDRIVILQNDLRRKTATLSTIVEIQRLVLRREPISNILKEIINGVRKLIKNDLAGIYLIDRTKKSLSAKFLSKRTSFARTLERWSLPLGKGLVGTAAMNGKMLLVNNAHMDPRSLYPRGNRPNLEHLVIVPLRVADTVFGVLAVSRNCDPGFLEEDAHIIKSFADATAVAIENAKHTVKAQKNRRRSKGNRKNSDFDDLHVLDSPEVIKHSTILNRR
jgi:PAS domain S-box-containing protein